MPGSMITKQHIADTMKQLMADRPPAKISVGDIVTRSGLNRNSFYYHFRDKHDLINWIFSTDLAREFHGEQMRRISLWELIGRLCSFLYRDRKFYRNALEAQGQNSFEEYYRELLRNLMASRVPAPFEDGELMELYSDFLADAFSAATLRWLRSDDLCPPEQIAALLQRAATEAAVQILDASDEALL